MLALQAVINGLTIGAAYALIGLPVVLIFRASRVANFAIGGMVVWTGLIGSLLTAAMPLGLAYLALLIVCVVGSLLFYFLCMRFVFGKSEVVGVLVTLAVSFALEGLAAMLFGPDTHSFPRLIPFASLTIVEGQLSLPSDALVALAILAVVFLVLRYLLTATEFGRDIRAVSDDPDTAKVLGVKVNKVMIMTYGLLGLSIFAASAAIVPSQGVNAFEGLPLLIGTMIGVTIGGLERLESAVVGGLLVGMLTSMSITVFNAFYQACALAVLVLVVLLFRPRGLLSSLRGRDIA